MGQHRHNIYFLTFITAVFLSVLLVSFTGCKKSGSSSGETVVYIDTNAVEWNLDGGVNGETVVVFLQGEDLQGIVLDSIQMRGDDASAAPLDATQATLQSNRVRAEFDKIGVMSRLQNPSAGSEHTISVSFLRSTGSQRQEVNARVSVPSSQSAAAVDPANLAVELSPAEWDLGFADSSGQVMAFVRGQGIESIDLDSFILTGDNGSTAPLEALSTTREGNHVKARFAKSGVIALLLNPAAGTTHTVTLGFMETGGTTWLEIEVTVVITDDEENPIDPEELSLEIDPVEWSMNFSNSSGWVKGFITGEGIENIDLTSIELAGDNGSVSPLAASQAALNGDHIEARFDKSQVIGLLLNPAPGTSHTLTVTFTDTAGTETYSLTAVITIEDDDDDDIDPSNLTLDISPSNWNTNYPKSNGSIQAFIRGEGFDNIDLNSLELVGAAGSLAPSGVSREGNHVKAQFAKNEVLGILNNPTSGTSHTVKVTFSGQTGGSFELSAQVRIVGN